MSHRLKIKRDTTTEPEWYDATDTSSVLVLIVSGGHSRAKRLDPASSRTSYYGLAKESG